MKTESLDEDDQSELEAVICTRSEPVFDETANLMKILGFKVVKVNDGVEVLQRYVRHNPRLMIIDNNLSKLNSDELLNQIVRINASGQQKIKVLVICNDNNRDTIIGIMKPVKASKGTIKLGLLVVPWKIPDFYRQIANLHPDDSDIKSKIESSLSKFRDHEIESLNETRLFLGVSEIGQGLRIELGDDRVLSVTSDTADDYAKKIEKALLSTSVEYIQFSLEATVDLLPANVVALMMLINGFSSKHKKEILFVAIPPQVKKQIESFGLEDVLPLEHDVQLF